MRVRGFLAMGVVAMAIAIGGGRAIAAATPIEHVVVIFQENVSFDHYFGTYPVAANTGAAGEPIFHADPETPGVNGLSPILKTVPDCSMS
jgi:phospholipase C